MNEVIDPRSVDRPNSYIGKSVPRPNAAKLVEGRGQYVDDMILPRMVHVAFVRSPHAHAKIADIDAATRCSCRACCACSRAATSPPHCDPWVAVLAHLKGMKSAPQLPLPLERATWVGEAVAAVVAESRAIAEDAVAKVAVDLRAAAGGRRHGDGARRADAPVIHPELGDNLCFQRVNESGKVDEAFNAAHKVVEATFHTGRHTGVTLEPRSILADYNRASAKLTVLSRHAGAAHDAGRVRQAHAPARGRRARDLHRRRRQLRHQGARLSRRGGRRRHRQDHGPPRQVHRRPAGELLHRHPRPRPPHHRRAWPSTPRAASPPSTSTT